MEGLCRTQALVEMDLPDAEVLLSRPLGNHIVLAFGHYAGLAKKYLDLAGIGTSHQTKKS
jgi:L-fucose isomerase-like protein